MVAALYREICTDCVLALIHGMYVGLMGYNRYLRWLPMSTYARSQLLTGARNLVTSSGRKQLLLLAARAAAVGRMSPIEMITDEGLATRGIDCALSGIRKKIVEISLYTLHSAAQRLRFINCRTS